MVKEIENIKLLVMEIIGYANGVMGDKVDTKMHRYFNEKASEVNNKIDKALRELQPLERIPEETRPTGEEELRELRNKFVKFWTDLDSLGYVKIPLKDDDSRKLLEFIREQLSLAREEAYKKIYDFVELESGKSGRKEILKFIDSLSNQSKDENQKDRN